MNRRTFIRSTGLALVAAGMPIKSRSATSPSELRSSRVLVQEARGRCLTPVALDQRCIVSVPNPVALHWDLAW
jgi:hypothetical protein